MTFNGSAIKALLDDAVSKGAVHGIAAVVVNRSGQLFHHAAGEAGQHAVFRNVWRDNLDERRATIKMRMSRQG
jgi:methyl acetate hydrolase